MLDNNNEQYDITFYTDGFSREGTHGGACVVITTRMAANPKHIGELQFPAAKHYRAFVGDFEKGSA